MMKFALVPENHQKHNHTSMIPTKTKLNCQTWLLLLLHLLFHHTKNRFNHKKSHCINFYWPLIILIRPLLNGNSSNFPARLLHFKSIVNCFSFLFLSCIPFYYYKETILHAKLLLSRFINCLHMLNNDINKNI